MKLRPQTIQKAERKFGEQFPPDILTSIEVDEEARLFALSIDDMLSTEFASLFTNFHAIQDIVKETMHNQYVLVILDSTCTHIEKLIGKVKSDISSVELVGLAKSVNKIWNIRRHPEDASILQGWFKTFLIIDYIKAILFSIENDTNEEFADIGAKTVIMNDGWFIFDTQMEASKKKQKQYNQSANTNTNQSTNTNTNLNTSQNTNLNSSTSVDDINDWSKYKWDKIF